MTTIIKDWLETATERRRVFTADIHRPRYHFLPPDGWTNDPNGVIQWKGEYHLFYQHNPHGPFWGTIHWGHAVSRDLIHWQDLPIALTPSFNGPDKDGCFSGCAVDNNGTPTLIYTGVADDKQTQCLAMSRDELLTWEKYQGNPVLATPPEDVRPLDFRDPWVWREGNAWYMVLASGQLGGGGVALLYRSSDLRNWNPLPHLLTGEVEMTGEVWECPNFFPLGDKHVLIISVWPRHSVHFFIGSFADERFVPESHGVLDPDGSLFAPLTLNDDKGRRLLWGWIDEQRSREVQQSVGWAGVMSLPRELSLDKGKLHTAFVPELQKLRRAHTKLTDLNIAEAVDVEGVKGPAFELRLALVRGSASRSGLTLARSPSGEEETHIYADWEKGELVIDRTHSSLLSGVERSIQSGTLPFAERLYLHLYLDGSVLELIADEQLTLSTRIYPSRDDSVGIRLFSSGGVSKLTTLEVWELASIWF